MEYMAAKEAAEKWGISECRVQVLCEQGALEGFQRLGKVRAIAKYVAKPIDARKANIIK